LGLEKCTSTLGLWTHRSLILIRFPSCGLLLVKEWVRSREYNISRTSFGAFVQGFLLLPFTPHCLPYSSFFLI
jgi:hypothetical protein